MCVILGQALNLMPATQAREVVAGYADLITPGSYMVVSCAPFDDGEMWQALSATVTVTVPRNHARRTDAGFLAGLELVPPGLVAAQG